MPDIVEVLPGCFVPVHGIAIIRFAADNRCAIEVGIATPSMVISHTHVFDNEEAARAWMTRLVG